MAHRGGELIADPLLNVGVVVAVSRASGLQLELVARRPVDSRDAARRQADIRNGTEVRAAPRVLLPPHDEGRDLRIGWFDKAAERVRWAHPAAYERSSSNTSGPVDLLTYLLPPLFDQVDLVFAWPEIGFEERVVSLTLPDRATAERASTSVWDASPLPARAPTWTQQLSVPPRAEQVRPDEGKTVFDPHVVWRSTNAVVVLTRLSRHEGVWQLELLGHARDTGADIASGAARAARRAFADGDVTAQHGGLTAGLVHGRTVHWDRFASGQSTGGSGVYEATRLSTLPDFDRDPADALRVAVRWPAVGLSDTELSLQVARSR